MNVHEVEKNYAEHRAANPTAEDLQAERFAHETRMALESQKAEQPEKNDPFDTVREKIEGGGFNSIHELHTELTGGKIIERPVEEEPFDADAYCREYGLPANYLDNLSELAKADGVSQRELASRALAQFHGQETVSAANAAVDSIAIDDSMKEVTQRTASWYDQQSSARYGTSKEKLSDAQISERKKLARVAASILQAKLATGSTAPKIEQVLNLARLQTDKSWSPSFRKSPASTATNIHAALQQM